MHTFQRLSQVYHSSETIPFNDNSKFVFFSDCHRGDGSKADNFYKNRDIYLHSLNYYYEKGFTYIELGDGDELWENDRFSTLFGTHAEAYLLLRKFYLDKRLYMLWGNHDVFKSSRNYVKNALFQYYDSAAQSYKPLFENIKIHEGLILQYTNMSYEIFLVHGHQGDILDDFLWPFSRFFVRHVWKFIENLNNGSRINIARRKERLEAVEGSIKQWARSKKKVVIAGHTHKTAFPLSGQIPYFNDGCCVKKRHITCIEIQNGRISLLKWVRSLNSDGADFVTKEIIAGPERIEAYFQ